MIFILSVFVGDKLHAHDLLIGQTHTPTHTRKTLSFWCFCASVILNQAAIASFASYHMEHL